MENVVRPKKGVWSILRLSLQGKEIDVSKGDLRLAITVLAVPMVLEMLMESLFSIVDVFFVGKLGVNAVATIGLTESLMSVVYSVGIGIGMAATALIARRVGEKKFKKAGVAVIQVLYLSLFFSLLTGVTGYFYTEEMLGLMGASAEVISEGAIYTKLVFASNITIILLFVINGIFRGAGNAAVAMHALWLSNLLNILLDPLLIFGFGPIPAMGLEGAAIATILGRTAGLLFQLSILVKGSSSSLQISKESFALKLKTLRNLFKLSAGGMGQFVIESASWIFLIKIVADYGSTALAAYTIAYRIMMFTILPGWGMANASATLVGQNLGAGNISRAEKSIWKTGKYNAVFLGIISVAFLLFPTAFVGLFTSDTQVITESTTGLQLFSAGFVFFAFGMVLCQSLNGAGDTRTPALINTLVFVIIQIPLAYILSGPLNLQAAGVYLAITLSYAIHALVSYLVIRKGKWKKVVV